MFCNWDFEVVGLERLERAGHIGSLERRPIPS
jgi:hypothetical protein